MKPSPFPARWALPAVLAVAAAASQAAPVSFSVTPQSFTPGTGYGTTFGKLDVSFSASGANQAFTLDTATPSTTFDFGTVVFQSEGFIGQLEANGDLSVKATFSFTDPLAGLQSVTAVGTAFTGIVADALVDYTIDWAPVTVAFGNGGLFKIDMTDLSFTKSGTKTQTATITLLAAPNAVPEPGSFALAGLALAGLLAARRRR